MAENIDRARLVAILDAGKDAQSRALALGQESQEIREAVRLAKLTAEASRRTVTAKGGQVVHEIPEASLAKVAALVEQFTRLEDRRQQMWDELSPRIELARACYKFAREHKIEAGHHDF